MRFRKPMAFLMMALTGFWQVAPTLHAATLTWDTVAGDGGSISGGSGTWTNGLGNWNTGSGDTTWNSATPDGAIFGGTAGTVTLGGAVTVGNMVFNSGYAIAGGGNVLTLSNSTITANSAATIGAALGGSTGLIKDGTGTLTLSGTNSYTGVTAINSGILSTASLANGGGNSGIGASSNAAANLILNSTLQYTGAATSTDRLFTLSSLAPTVDASGSGALSFTNTGSLAFSSAGPRTLTLTGTNTDNNSFAPVIGDNGGATALTKSGAGTWLLTGANTYTGTTTISSGVLQIGNGGTSGALGSGAVNDSASLVINRSDAITIGNTISGAGSFTQAGTGTTTITGSMSISGATNVNAGVLQAGGTFVFGTNSTVNVSSGAVFALNGFNTAIGPLSGAGTVRNGTATAATLSAGGTASTSFDGTIQNGGSASLAFNKTGSGTLTLTGANTYTGGTLVSNGVLSVSSLANGGAASNIGSSTNSASALALNGGTLTYTGGAASTDRLFSVGTTGGAVDASGTGALNFSNAGSMGFIGQSGTRTLTLTGSSTDNNTLAAVIGDNGGATGLTKSGTGTWIVSGSSTYTGATTITGGQLVVSSLANGGSVSNIGAASSAAANLVLNGGALKYTGAGGSTDRLFSVGLASGTLDASGSGAVNFTNTGSIGSNGQTSARTLILTGTNTGNNTLAATIPDFPGSTAVDKNGTGTWVLTGASTYTGITTVSGGVLSATNLANGGTASSLGATSASAGGLVLNGGTLQYSGAASATTDRLISVSTSGGSLDASGTGAVNFSNTGSIGFNSQSGARTLTLTGTNTGSNTLAGLIADNGGATALTKTGTGSWTLSGANSYTGVTTIAGGVLSVTSLANGGTSSGIGAATNVASNLVLNGGTLQYNNTTTANTDRLFSVGTSGGTISLPVLGTLNLTNTGNIGFNGQSGARTVTFAFSDNPSNGGTIVLSSGITDNGGATSLLKANAYGNLRLTSNNNTYTGTTTINGGSVSIGVVGGSTGSIGSGNIVVNSGGTLVSSRSGTVNLSQTISGAGGVTLNGNTQLTLSGTNTYTGATTILGNGGVVIVSDIENGGVASSIGASSSAAGNLSITNLSTLRYTGAGATTDRLFSVPTGTANPVGTIEASGSGALVFTNAGAMGFGGLTGARTLVLSGTNTQNNTMTPVIGDNSGATALTKSGTGTWVVAGANSYTGVTTVSGGVMSVSSLANGGSNSNIGASTNAATNVVLNGGTLQYTGAAVSTDRLFSVGTSGGTLDASGTGAVNFTNTGSMSFNSQTGTRTLTLTGTNTGSNILAAVIGDNGGATSLTKSGAGTWVLAGANTYTGTTTINAGTLALGNGGSTGSISGNIVDNGTLLLNNTSGLNLSQTISGTGGITVTAGSSTLSGNNTYTGVTTITGGVTLAVTTLANGGVASSLGAASNAAGNIIMNNGFISYTGTGASTDRLFSVGVAGGALASSGTGAVNFTNTGSIGYNNQTGIRNFTLTGANTGANTLAASIGDNGGATNLYKEGAGTWVLTGANVYSGTTTINTGLLQVGNGGTSGTLGFGAVINNANLTFNRSDAFTVSASISGAGTITQAGAGTTTLSGVNTYTGVTVINAGVIKITFIANGGSNSNIGASSNAASNLVLNGGTLQYANAAASTDRLFSVGTNGGTLDASGTGAVNFTNTGSMGFNSQTGARTLTLTGTNTGANTLAAVIGDNSGATALTKAGAGAWVLTGANSYSGVTTVSGGVLQIGNGGTSGTLGGGSVTDNANLTFNRSDTVTISNNISGTGSLTQAGTGTTILTGVNSYASATTISAGTLQIGNGGTTGSPGSGAITNNGTLIVNLSNAITISGVMSGAGTFVQNGTGTTTLSGLSNQWGSATVNAGVLAAGVASGLGNASPMTVNSGGTLATNGMPVGAAVGSIAGSGIVQNGSAVNSGLIVSGNTSTTFSGVMQDGGIGTLFLTKMGAATTLTLSGSSSTYTGGTTINGGSLIISTLANGGSASSIGASTNAASNLILNSPTAVLKYTGAAVSTDRLFSIGSGSGTLDASGTGAVNFTNTGAMGFNSQTGARTLTLSGTNAGSNTLAALIGDNSGATALTKSGAGTWVLSGANNYTGVTAVNGGVLAVSSLANGGSASNIGAATNVAANLLLNQGGTLQYTGVGTSTDRLFSIGGVTGGTLDASGTGAINFTNTGAVSILGSNALTLTLTGTNTGANTLAAVVGNGTNTTSLTKAGTGSWVLTGTNTYTGVTTINGGVLSVSSLASGGTSSGIGAASNAAANLVLNGGTLQYTGAATSTARVFSVGTTAGSALDSSGSGAVNFTSGGIMGFNSQSGARTLTLTGTNTGNNTISILIGDNGGATSITKSGSGTWQLSSSSGYTGVTTINGGVFKALLLFNGGSNSSIGAATSLATNLVLDGGTLQYTGSGSSTDRLFSVGTGGGTLDASGSSAVNFTNTGSMGFNGQNGGRTLTLTGANTGSNTLSAIIGESGGTTAVGKSGNGTWLLTGVNTYAGATTISGGKLMVSNLADGGSASSIGAASNAASNLVLNSATLQYTGSGESTDRLFSIGTGSGTLDASGTGAVNFTNAGAMGFNGQSGTRTLTLAGTNVGANTLAAAIGDNGGATTVLKTGAGKWMLNGVSGYTGPTNVFQGVLSAATLANGGVSSSIGASSNAAGNLLIDGGTFQYTGVAVSTDRLFSVGTLNATVDASGTGAVSFTNAGSLGFSGTGTRTLILSGTNTGSNTLAAAIGDNGGATTLTKSGAGTWVITGANTYTGATNITAGTLQVGNGGTTGTLGSGTVSNSGALVINRSDALTIANAISGTGTFTQAGAGTTTFSTGTKSYTGATFVNAGKLQAGGANAFSASSAITVASGAILEINGFNVATGGLSGSGTVQNGTATGATLNIGGSASASFDGLIQNGGSGFIAINKGGSGGTLTLTGSNTYTGGTVVSAGTLSVATLANGGVASNIGASSNAASSLILTGGTLSYTGAAVSTDRLFSVTTNGGTLDASGTGAVNFTNTGSMGFNSQTGARILTLTGTNTGANTIAAVIGDNVGATSLVKTGAGKWVLTGSSSYSGATTITGGVLAVSILSNGGTSSSLGAATNAASNLVINGATLQYLGGATSTDRLFSVGSSGATLDASGTGAVNFAGTGSMGFNGQTGARTLTLTGTNTGGNSIAAIISDNGGGTALVKTGAGTWSLTGANTYSGSTTISGGVLSVTTLASAGSSSLGSSSNAASNLVLDGGTLQYLGAGNAITSRLFSVGTGGGTLDISGGAVNFSGSGSMGFNGQSGARTLTLTGSSTSTSNALAAVIGDNGGATSLVKQGAGYWALTGSNTYTGATTIKAGILAVSQLANGGSASGLGAASSAAASLVLDGGTLRSSAVTASTDRLFSVGLGGGTIDASSGYLNFTNTGALGFNGQSGARTLTLSGYMRMAPSIGDSGGATSLVINALGYSVTLAGNNTYSGSTTIPSGSTLNVGEGGYTGTLGTGDVVLNGFMTFSRSDTVTVANNISGTGTVLINDGINGVSIFSGSNTYTHGTAVIGGTLRVSSLANGGVASNVGASDSSAGNLQIQGATLQYVGSGASTDRLFLLGFHGGTLDASGTGALRFTNTGSLIYSLTTARTFTLSGSNTDDNTFSPVIADAGDATSVTKSGPGTWVLAGASTYTGATTITGGILRVNTLANAGSSSNVGASDNAASNLVLYGGTLQYTGAAATTDRLFSVGTSGGTVDASGTGAVNFTNAGSMGFNGQSGARTLTLTGTNTGSNTLAAGIGDNGGATALVKAGAGTWVLTGTNTYTGTTTISAGVLQVGNGNTSGSLGSGAVINNAQLTVNRSDAVSIGNDISGSGAFTQAGTGTTTLSGSNSYTGVTTIASGVLNVTSLANGGSSSGIGASSNAASNLVMNGGTLQYTGSSNVSTNRLFSVGIGSAVIDVSGSGTVNFTNTGSMGFNGESGARTLTLTGTNTSGPNIIAAAIGDFGGATSVVIDGAATWVLTGANTYTGATTLSSGVLQIGGSSLTSAIIVGANAILEIDGLNTSIGSLAGSGTVRNNAGTAATLTMGGNDLSTSFSGVIKDGGAGALSLVKTGAGTFTLTGANTYSGTTTISSGVLQVGSGGTTGTLGSGEVTNNAQLTINRSNAIALDNDISGSGSLTQAGSGTSTLSGNSSYTGSTTINAGVLSVGTLANGGSSSNIGASSNAASNLVLNGGTLQYTGGNVSTDRLFSVGTNGGTLDASGTGTVNFTNTGSMGFNGQSGIRTLTLTGSNSGGNTIAAVIGDNGGATALTKSGTGTWVLTGANTYTGNTAVNAGTLQIGDGGTTGALSTSSALNIDGTLAFNRSDTVTQGGDFANVISGSGGVTQAGGGTLTLNGSNTYAGATNVRSGTLEVASNNALGTNAAGTQVSSGGTLLLNNVNYSTAEDLTLNGSGAGNGGALRNSGTSTYTGQITAATDASINAGGGILNLMGGLVKDGTVLTITGGGTVYVSGTGISGTSANSDLVVDGTALVVSADSDYNGPTTVKNGAVLVANAAVTTTQFELSRDSTLAGTGSITTAMNESIFINGVMSVGDPAVFPTATSFALSTSGAGAVVLGAGSLIHLDLFTGAGAGNNLANASAADSINLHGKIDVTAGSTLVIGNPNGMTGFRGGDQWQLFNLNSGSANAGSFVSNLALNDSSLSLASGVTSYLDQSTGVFSIIDTNGGLATAAAEGQALIGGGNTVTADLNGHLFNLRAGGGEEEEDAGSGSIAAALYEEVIVGEGDGDSEKKESPIVKSVPRSRQWEVFATVNYGNVKLSPIRTQSGVQVDSWASGAGIERHFTRGLTLGFAVSFLQSTQGFTGNLGSLYMEGPALSSYASYVRGAFWNSLLYSFGTYQMDSVRNPGAPFPTANGSTRAYTHSVQYNTGWNFRFQNKTLVTGPFAGVDYLHGTVDAYSETGGGLAALHYGAQSFQSLVSRVGWSASKKFETRFGMITPQVRLSYERQNIKNNNGTHVSLINVPFSSFAGNQNPGQDYLVAGMGVSIAFSERFSLMLSYQGQFFRHDLQAHFGSVRFSYQF